MIKEYINFDIDEEVNFENIKKLKKGTSVFKLKKNITTLTPPLLCKDIVIWKDKKTSTIKKYKLDLLLTQNEWRFTDFLSRVSSRSKYCINEYLLDNPLFSTRTLQNNYKNLFVEDIVDSNDYIISFQSNQRKNLETLKSYKNQYINLIITFKGVLINNGVYQELWYIDKIEKKSDDDSDYEYDFSDITNDVTNEPEPETKTEIKTKKEIEKE